MQLNKDEINALLIMASNAPVAGKDARFVADLIDKLAAMLEESKPAEKE